MQTASIKQAANDTHIRMRDISRTLQTENTANPACTPATFATLRAEFDRLSIRHRALVEASYHNS